MSNDKTVVLEHEQIALIVERFAHQIFEKHHRKKELVLIGIDGRGLEVAERIFKHLKRISDQKLALLTISLDKLKPHSSPVLLSGELTALKGKTVILIDDVLNSGRTLIHAVQHILQGEVASISTVVLVDRIHRDFPIKADMVGMTLSTTLQERVEVELGKKDFAYLV